MKLQEKNSDMKKLIYVLILLVTPFYFINAQSTDTQALLDEYLATLPDQAEIAIGLISKGEIYKQGYQKNNGVIIPIKNNQHVFEIGSITKTFTAALVLQQQLDGKLNLQAPMHKYFPADEFHPGMDSIQIQHLITHTSGLAKATDALFWPYFRAVLFSGRQPHKHVKWKHYKKYLINNPPDTLAGKEWNYNNGGYSLLGQILEEQNKSTWESQLKEKIFDQLGMKHSYATGKGVPNKLKVQGYDIKGKKAPYWDMQFMNPAGSIKSCIDDMLVWLETHLTALPGTLYYEMQKNYEIETGWADSQMGNGWAHRLKDGNHTIWHGGATGAFRSYTSFNREEQTGVIILVNFNANHPDMKDEQNKSNIRKYGIRLLESLSK